MKKKELDKKLKFAPSLKNEGYFTQISNHIILNPELTAEEKEFILVYLISKNGFEMTIDGFCEDLHIKPRQVIKTINSLIQKGVFEISATHYRLNIVKIDNPKYKLKAEKSVLDDSSLPEKDVLLDNKKCLIERVKSEKDVIQDNKSCAVTQVLPEKDALDDTNICAETQVIPELSLEYQGIADAEKTNNKPGSEARTYTKGARPSDNMLKDSVNAVLETSSSDGRTPYEGAPSHNPTGNPNDFFNNLDSCFTSTDTDCRSPYEAAPIVSEFWTDENTTNLNYRWYKIELDKNSNFKYTFSQFEEILAIALYSYLVINEMKIPESNATLQTFGRYIGKLNNDPDHISERDIKIAITIYDSSGAEDDEVRKSIFDQWKIKQTVVDNISPQVEPITRQLPAVTVLSDRERVKQIAIGLREKSGL